MNQSITPQVTTKIYHEKCMMKTFDHQTLIYDKNVSSILNKLEKEGREQAFAAWLNTKIEHIIVQIYVLTMYTRFL